MVEPSIEDTVETLLQRTVDRRPTRADVDAAVAALGAEIGIADLALDEDGMAELSVDDDVDVTLMYLPHTPGLVLAAEVANARDLGDEELRDLLQSNLSWDLTLGGAFAMLPESEEVLLCRLMLSAGREAAELDEEIDAFVEVVRGWREALGERLQEVEEPREVPPPTGMIRA